MVLEAVGEGDDDFHSVECSAGHRKGMSRMDDASLFVKLFCLTYNYSFFLYDLTYSYEMILTQNLLHL